MKRENEGAGVCLFSVCLFSMILCLQDEARERGRERERERERKIMRNGKFIPF
jgi:hypothetical protein